MKNTILFICLPVLIAVTPAAALEPDTAAAQRESKEHLRISIEIGGLSELTSQINGSLELLNQALERTNTTLADLQANPGSLSTEQLQALTDFAQAVDEMTASGQLLLTSADSTLRDLEEPAYVFLQNSLDQTYRQIISPSLERVIAEASFWRWTLVVMITLVLALLFYILLTSRNLITLIVDQYRLVHVSNIKDTDE